MSSGDRGLAEAICDAFDDALQAVRARRHGWPRCDRRPLRRCASGGWRSRRAVADGARHAASRTSRHAGYRRRRRSAPRRVATLRRHHRCSRSGPVRQGATHDRWSSRAPPQTGRRGARRRCRIVARSQRVTSTSVTATPRDRSCTRRVADASRRTGPTARRLDLVTTAGSAEHVRSAPPVNLERARAQTACSCRGAAPRQDVQVLGALGEPEGAAHALMPKRRRSSLSVSEIDWDDVRRRDRRAQPSIAATRDSRRGGSDTVLAERAQPARHRAADPRAPASATRGTDHGTPSAPGDGLHALTGVPEARRSTRAARPRTRDRSTRRCAAGVDAAGGR